jgi:hypothetical protein
LDFVFVVDADNTETAQQKVKSKRSKVHDEKGKGDAVCNSNG